MAIEDTSNPWYRGDTASILEIYDTDTNTRQTVSEFDYVIEAPNWSADGKSLYYNSEGRIYRFELDTRISHVVDTGFADNCNNDHVLSPDGHYIAVSHGKKEDGRSRIYILPVEGGTPRLITPLGPSYLHGWSPDGLSLAYCAERDGKYDVYTISAGGGEEQRLTNTPGLDDGPEYDPSGEYIWFNSSRTGLMQVWRMRCDGSEQTQVTFDEERNSWFPHISPDGKRVIILSYKKGDVKPEEHLPNKNVELRIMSSKGGEVYKVAELFGGQGTINVNSWSPDSRKFAFVRYKKRV